LTGVSVVIPAYNEEAGVGPQVKSVRGGLQSHGIPHEIIVVDDGSEDRTAEEAVRAGARVLRHLNNRGYGASLKTGIMAATYEAIAITDADGTYPSDQIPVLLKQLESADMVVGARTGKKVSIPWVRKPGKWALGWLANPVSWRTGYMKLPEASPVKGRPVRLEPWAPGARPRTITRALGSPKPGTGFPQ